MDVDEDEDEEDSPAAADTTRTGGADAAAAAASNETEKKDAAVAKDAAAPASSSSDDDDDDDKDVAPKKKEAANSSAALMDSDDDDDDDDDEGDVEFDDQGAVVGLKSKTMAGSIKRAGNNIDTAASNTAAAAAAESPRAAQETDRRILTVQEVNKPTSSSTTLHMTKLPNILGIQTEAFEPDEYLAAQEEEDFGQAAFNLMRWRYQRDAAGHLVRDAANDDRLVRESNTRLVEWEDGSYTLHVGTEAFQVDSLDLANAETGFSHLNGYLYLSQAATYKQPKKDQTEEEGKDDNDDNGDDDDDDEPQPAGTVLECMGPIRSRLTVRPSSLQSEAHKSLTVGIRQKTIKKARIAEFVTQEDPEKLKQERIKVKQDLEKAAMRKKQGSAGYYQNPRAAGAPRRPRMSRDYLEDDRDYDTTNLKDMKRRTMGGDYEEDEEGLGDYGDDGDDSVGDEEVFRTVRPGRGKGGKPKKDGEPKEEESDEDEMFLGGEDDDEDDDGFVAKAKATKKRSHQAVLDDDDSD